MKESFRNDASNGAKSSREWMQSLPSPVVVDAEAGAASRLPRSLVGFNNRADDYVGNSVQGLTSSKLHSSSEILLHAYSHTVSSVEFQIQLNRILMRRMGTMEGPHV